MGLPGQDNHCMGGIHVTRQVEITTQMISLAKYLKPGPSMTCLKSLIINGREDGKFNWIFSHDLFVSF